MVIAAILPGIAFVRLGNAMMTISRDIQERLLIAGILLRGDVTAGALMG